MEDREIESLLRRYRPMAPTVDPDRQITKSPNLQTTKLPTTWPWAVAAAALLALTVGVHAATFFAGSEEQDPLDPRRVQAVADDLGGLQNLVMAEWIVRQEARAEREVQLARTAWHPDPENRQ
jgi:hypothetical protein